ncbi:MAG: glycosyltransferase family 4 protein [Thermoplasmatales archaeon]
MVKTNKFRILIYSDHFFPSVGGSENYAMDLATELSRQGHTVGLITSEKTTEPDKFPFRVYRLSKPLSLHKINFNFLEIPHIIKIFEPHVFHISYQGGGENLLIPILKAMKIPIVLTYHADHVVTLGKIVDELQIISTFKLVNMILVQSNRDMKKMKSRGISQKRLRLENFNGVDTDKYHYSQKILDDNPSCLKLVCIARLDDGHAYKGIDRLLVAALESRYLFDTKKIVLNIIGDGNLREAYEKFVKSNNLPNINFLGHLSDDYLIKLLRDSDFLLLPSTNKAEGFGRVALESISCGTPVIVSKYAGISELIEKYNSGFVYDPYGIINVFEIANELGKSRSRINGMVQRGTLMISRECLTLKSTVERTVLCYRELVDEEE